MTQWIRVFSICSIVLLTPATLCAEVVDLFGRNSAWLAVRNVPGPRVASLLNVKGIHDADWQSGVDQAVYAKPKEPLTRQSLSNNGFPYPETDLAFISPEVNGWTLVASQQLAYLQSFAFPRIPPARYSDKVVDFVKQFSRDADAEVQYFLSFETPETHIWVLANRGQIVRAYGYSGERIEVMFNVGQPTRAERDLKIVFPPNSEELFSGGKFKAPTSRDLLALAAQWSIDPSAIDSKYAKMRGWIGALPGRSPQAAR